MTACSRCRRRTASTVEAMEDVDRTFELCRLCRREWVRRDDPPREEEPGDR